MLHPTTSHWPPSQPNTDTPQGHAQTNPTSSPPSHSSSGGSAGQHFTQPKQRYWHVKLLRPTLQAPPFDVRLTTSHYDSRLVLAIVTAMAMVMVMANALFQRAEDNAHTRAQNDPGHSQNRPQGITSGSRKHKNGIGWPSFHSPLSQTWRGLQTRKHTPIPQAHPLELGLRVYGIGLESVSRSDSVQSQNQTTR